MRQIIMNSQVALKMGNIRNVYTAVTLLQKVSAPKNKGFSRGEVSNANQIKRRNWENVKMFGPLLKSARKSRKKSKSEVQQCDDVQVIDAECVETGFRDLDAPNPSRKITTKKLLLFQMFDIFTGNQSGRSNISVDESSGLNTSDGSMEDKDDGQTVINREFCFPGNMFDVPDGSTQQNLYKNPQKRTHFPKIDVIPESSFPVASSSTEKEIKIRKRFALPDNLIEHRDKSVELTDCISQFPFCYVQENEAKQLSTVQERIVKLWQEFGAEKQFPSVSTVLQKTMPQDSVEMLEKWKKGMIERLGMEGFLKYQQETLYLGTSLHSNIAELLHGRPEEDIEIDERNRGHWKSVRSILDKVSDVQLLEERVRHPYLHYCGSIDCVAKHLGTTVLIEWKTSQKPKPLLNSTFDNPIQVAAYLGALNCESKLGTQVERALLVVAYPSGTKAHVHYMSREVCQQYWKVWLDRLELYFRTHVIKL